MNVKCFLVVKTGESRHVIIGEGLETRSSVYRRDDTREEFTLRDAPVGAIWRASWYEDAEWPELVGVDGRSYVVKTPGGDWLIDSVASNCTRKDDKIHKCWCRHGEAPNFHVDKVGNTCAAGAGSILIGNYHGFLHNGYLTDCP